MRLFTLTLMGALVALVGCDASAPDAVGGAYVQTETVAGEVASARADKVDVCHLGDDGYELISISSSAVRAHLDHGDGVPSGDVPNQPGFSFGDSCEIVEAALVSCGTEYGTDPASGAEMLTITLTVLDPEGLRAEAAQTVITGDGAGAGAALGTTITDTGDPDYLIVTYTSRVSSVNGPIEAAIRVRPLPGDYGPGTTCGPYLVGGRAS